MRDNLLFVDTETSGVPRSMDAPVQELESWPFVLQVAWQIYDRKSNLIKKENHFIWEPEIYIETSSIKIHGITETDLKSRGEDRKAVMWRLLHDLKMYKPMIVGHFVEFDIKMLQVALIRCGLRHNLDKYRHFCTMRATTGYSRFPTHNYPKLGELYQGLFKEVMPAQHDAEVDAEATARCFFELRRRGEITEDMIENQSLYLKVKEGVRKNTGCGLPVLLFILYGIVLFLT